MKTVIEMAREAGPLISTPFDVWCERFADLIRADERNKWMERTAILIRGEREACAQVCDDATKLLDSLGNCAGADETSACAAAIRNRSNT